MKDHLLLSLFHRMISPLCNTDLCICLKTTTTTSLASRGLSIRPDDVPSCQEQNSQGSEVAKFRDELVSASRNPHHQSPAADLINSAHSV